MTESRLQGPAYDTRREPFGSEISSASQTVHDKPMRLNCPQNMSFVALLVTFAREGVPAPAVCTTPIILKICRISVCIPHGNPSVVVNACPACCVALKPSVLWPLHPLATLLAHNISVAALVGSLGESQQQKPTCMFACSSARGCLLE